MIEPRCTVLPNGLRVLTVELPHLHSADVAIYLKVGARNDPEGRTGLSHFLEHILFRGTEDYKDSLAIEAAFESLGGQINAATDADSTCFFGRVHPSYAAQAVEILSSLLLKSRLEDIELERRIIVEEALDDINQEGREINPDLVMGRLLWPGHPLGEATVGTLKDIARISRTDLQQHLYNWYRPNNAVVVAAGPLEHDSVLEAVRRCLGDWQPAELPERLGLPDNLPSGPKFRFVQDSDSQVTVQLAFRACNRASEELATLKFLRRLMAGGGCSRLHLSLRERLGMVYSVDASIGSYDETGCLTIDFSTATENLLPTVKAAIDELKKLKLSSVPEQEFERVRTVMLAELDYSRDSVGEMGIRFGWGTLMGVARSIDQDQRMIKAVTAEKVKDLAGRMFRPDIFFMAVIGPLEAVDQQEVMKLLDL